MKKIIVLFILILVLGLTLPLHAEYVTPLLINNFSIGEDLSQEEELFPVYRKANPQIPITSTIYNLINIELTEEEKELGFSTDWSKARKVELIGVSLKKDGSLKIKLEDPLRFTTGGSARVQNLKLQIVETALQFERVKQVQFVGPDYLFQP